MAKKSFSEGLESLFSAAPGEVQVRTAVSSHPKRPSAKAEQAAAAATKTFADNMDELLREAMEEGIKEKQAQLAQQQKAEKKGHDIKSRLSDRLTGLDALIRSTLEESEVNIEEDHKKKRVTFVFDKEKIERLRDIARMEKAFIKDIVNELVSEFILEYEKKKGT